MDGWMDVVGQIAFVHGLMFKVHGYGKRVWIGRT